MTIIEMYTIQSTVQEVRDALAAEAASTANLDQVALVADIPSIVTPSNAPIILPCGDFSSTLIHSTTQSFGVEINCLTDAVVRCIAWIVNPLDEIVVNADDLEIKANFWSYANNANVAQDGESPIIVKDADAVSEEGSCQRVISFSNLQETPKQKWNARCSYTGDTGVCTLIFNDKLRQFPMIIIEMHPIQSTLAEVQAALAANPVNILQRALIAALPPIVQPGKAPIIPFCGEFSSKLVDPLAKSFGVQINCATDAVARCIGWIHWPKEGDDVDVTELERKSNFWSHSNDDNVKQYGVTAPIIVKDSVPEGESCQRIIRFLDLPTDSNPEWTARCSYTGNTGVCELRGDF